MASQKIARIVLEYNRKSPRLNHAKQLCSELGPLFRRNMVHHANGGDRVKMIVFKRQICTIVANIIHLWVALRGDSQTLTGDVHTAN